MKENYELIEKDLKTLEKDYSRYDIVDMIEMSNCIKLPKEYWETIQEHANDGINTYGLFIKFCYDKFIKSKYDSLYTFLQCETENCVKEFKKKYYVEE